MAEPGFWDHKERAQQVIDEASSVRSKTLPFSQLAEKADDLEVLLSLAQEESDPNSQLTAFREVHGEYETLSKELEAFELKMLLSGEFDKNNAFLTVHAGAGGTESCDWADMLFRMYQRWIERNGFKSQIIDIQEGDEAGIKSVTVLVSGEYAYGYIQIERAVHVLVRSSPFDSNKRRHPSFASVDAVPQLKEDVAVEINEKNLPINTFRSGGKGGENYKTGNT